jgi:hypothetical protein
MVQFSASDDSLDAPGEGLGGREPHSSKELRRQGAFTVESANQMLPLVERIVADLMTLSLELEQQSAQIRGIEHLPKPTNLAAYTDELTAIKESFSTDRQRLESCHRELAALGVKIDSLKDGAIDFPAFLNRRPVMLCWSVGEPSVAHWHYPGESVAHRREIADHRFDTAPPSVAQLP